MIAASHQITRSCDQHPPPPNPTSPSSSPASFHELIHTFGLGHSLYNGDEYGDNTSPMGDAPVCPSAGEMRRLG